MSSLLDPVQLRDVGFGSVDPATAAMLRRAQLGKRRLALAAVARSRSADLELLLRAEERDPAAVDLVVGDPFVDAWATGCVGPRGDAETDRPDFLSAISAAAAIRAGVPFEARLRGVAGVVVLPTLGAMVGLDADEVDMTYDGRILRTRAGGALRAIDPNDDSPWWQPIRTITAGAGQDALTLVVDDLNPYRDCYPWKPMPRLAQGAVDRLGGQFAEAWQWIRDHSPAYAAAVRDSVRSLVPLIKPTGAVDVSAASRLAFGAIGLAPPERSDTLALLLIHETQHLRLGAVADLVQLWRETGAAVHRAPWRVDPRPVSALTQGAYAHLGVADFWRMRREDPDADHRAASFEYAYSVEMTRRAVADLLTSGELTADGVAVCEAMVDAIDAWPALPADADYARAAMDVAEADAVRWNLLNQRPDDADAEALAARWRTDGAAGEPIPMVTAPRAALANAATGLSAAVRSRFVETCGSSGNAEDDAYAVGDHELALAGYRARAAADPADADAWVGLAMARRRLRLDPPDGALATRPGLVRDVFARLRPHATPEGVALWLDGAPRPEAARRSSSTALPLAR